MTFRNQQLLCLIAVVVGLPVAGLASELLRMSEASFWGPLLRVALTPLIVVGQLVAGLGFFMFLGRGVQRWIWLNVYRQPQATMPAERLERTYVDGWQSPFWRRWLWLNEAGDDRDA